MMKEVAIFLNVGNHDIYLPKNLAKLEILLYYCITFLLIFIFFIHDRTEYQVLTTKE